MLTKSRKKLRREPSAASQELESQRQGDASKSSKAAEKLSMEEASDLKERRKLATHVGRFKKVVKEKCVKGYSTHDLAAILGGSGSRQVRHLLHFRSPTGVPEVSHQNCPLGQLNFA